MWSCGIIMYMILSGGKHPLWSPGDSPNEYKAKLNEMKLEFPPNFTQ